MSFEPEPLPRLLLWRLAVGENGGAYLRHLEGKIAPAVRAPLLREKLISETKQKPADGIRPLIYLELTEKGWAWCQNHLTDEWESKSLLSGPVLQRLLGLLKRFFENQEHTVSLGQFVSQARSRKAPPPGDGETDLAQRVLQACLDLGRGERNVRVRLAELRPCIAGAPREALDATLLDLERQGVLALWPLDNPQEIGPEDRQAVVLTPAGSERHIVYLGGQTP